MGERHSKYAGGGVHPATEVKLNQPITITFVHEKKSANYFRSYHYQKSEPTCAYWNLESHRWTTQGCKLLETNDTHSKCSCLRLATFALLAPSSGRDYNNFRVLSPISADDSEFFGEPTETDVTGGGLNDILVGIMAAIILVLALVIVVVLFFYCRKRKVRAYSFFSFLCNRLTKKAF